MPVRPTFRSPCSLRHELGLGAEVFLVGAVGRLHHSKGMDVLIRAFRRVTRRGAALVIFGEGPQRAELERLCTGDSRIHLVGYRPDVRNHLSELDVFVSPSREESFGLAIVEAMESGAPIVTTRAAGPSEFLHHHPVTFVPVDSVDALAGALAQTHERFAHGALPRMNYDMTAFDPDTQLAQIADLYREVLSERTARAAQPRRVPALAT